LIALKIYHPKFVHLGHFVVGSKE